MKQALRFYFMLLLITAHALRTHAQTVDDVFTSGKILKYNHAVYIHGLEGPAVSYARSASPSLQDFERLRDSLLVMPKGDKDQVAIYCQALNPLKYSYEDNVVYYVDKIDEDADKALASIGDFIGGYVTKEYAIVYQNAQILMEGLGTQQPAIPAACSYKALKQSFDSIHLALKQDWKKKINDQFRLLVALEFTVTENPTAKVTSIRQDYERIKDDLAGIEAAIQSFKKDIESFQCADDRFFIDQFTLGLIVEKLQHAKAQQDARLANLKKALDAVEAVAKVAVLSGPFYYMPAVFVDIKRGKIAAAHITCYESGLMLSTEGEIVARSKKKLNERTILFRKFQRLVPEVLAGVAYTGLKYPLYGTGTDSAGVQRVVEAGEESIKRYAFNVMINFNYYISGSQVHPFWQIGIGTNLQNPVLLTGLGSRFRISNKLGFTMSFGAAFAVVKDLETLKVGDPVSGTADIEKDYKYNFDINRIKPYIAFQLAL